LWYVICVQRGKELIRIQIDLLGSALVGSKIGSAMGGVGGDLGDGENVGRCLSYIGESIWFYLDFKFG
jgi:hypothetical protein